jgi:hypothetical protein
MKKRVLSDIAKLSPDAQTSSLEGFHSTLNQWSPKMLAFSWLGSYCRCVDLCLTAICRMDVFDSLEVTDHEDTAVAYEILLMA